MVKGVLAREGLTYVESLIAMGVWKPPGDPENEIFEERFEAFVSNIQNQNRIVEATHLHWKKKRKFSPRYFYKIQNQKTVSRYIVSEGGHYRFSGKVIHQPIGSKDVFGVSIVSDVGDIDDFVADLSSRLDLWMGIIQQSKDP